MTHVLAACNLHSCEELSVCQAFIKHSTDKHSSLLCEPLGVSTFSEMRPTQNWDCKCVASHLGDKRGIKGYANAAQRWWVPCFWLQRKTQDYDKETLNTHWQQPGTKISNVFTKFIFCVFQYKALDVLNIAGNINFHQMLCYGTGR